MALSPVGEVAGHEDRGSRLRGQLPRKALGRFRLPRRYRDDTDGSGGSGSNNDPDEIEKRLNNRTRRVLKGVITACAVAGIAGALVSAAVGGGIVVTGLLAAFAGVSIAMSGPLASGESISSTDMVRMVQAMGDMIGKTTPPRSGHDGRKRR